MTTQQREQLREVLIDYLQVLTATSANDYPKEGYEINSKKIAQVRLLLREVA